MKKMVIKKKDIFYFILYTFMLIPFFKIPYISVVIPKISVLYKILAISAFGLSFLMLLKNKILSKFELFTFIFCLILLLSTFLNSGDLNQCILLVVSCITLTFVIGHGLKKNTKTFLNAFEFLLYVPVVINFFTIILIPNGLYASDSISFYTTNNWFLGFKNNHIIFIIPAILVSLINSYYTNNKLSKRTIILMIISLINLILVKSATGLVGVILITVLLFFGDIRKKTKPINVNSLMYTNIGMFFAIVIFRLQELFKFLIVDIFHKDITLTGRIYIWDYVMEFIKNKPILGYGIEDLKTRYYKTSYMQSYHAHNQILEVLYKTGFIGFFILVYIFYLSIKQLNKYKLNRCSKVISIVLFAELIMMLTEAYSLENIFILLGFGYNIGYLVKTEEEYAKK